MAQQCNAVWPEPKVCGEPSANLPGLHGDLCVRHEALFSERDAVDHQYFESLEYPAIRRRQGAREGWRRRQRKGRHGLAKPYACAGGCGDTLWITEREIRADAVFYALATGDGKGRCLEPAEKRRLLTLLLPCGDPWADGWIDQVIAVMGLQATGDDYRCGDCKYSGAQAVA